jgi:RimJ/RimL family protein N-acetyltransferase
VSAFHKVRKVATVLRDHYRSMSVGEFASFLGQALFMDERIAIYVMSLDQVPADGAGAPVAIRKGGAADLQAGRAALDRVPWELQCDIYDGVQDFFVHTDGAQIAHISWLYYRDDPNRILQLADSECEVKFCLTRPEFRGRGLYPAALTTIQQYLRQRGYKRCFICVKEGNEPSIRGIEKAGFQRVGSTRVRKALGVQVSRPRRTRDLSVPSSR